MKSPSRLSTSDTRPSRYGAAPFCVGPWKAATPLTKFQLFGLPSVRSEMPKPRIAPLKPSPTKLPSKLPVRLGLLLELVPPRVMTRKSEVEPKNALSENGTLFAPSCHVPPAFDPACGIVMAAWNCIVRLVKLALTCALAMVPAVLFWFVGEVAATIV